jgi:hypothetical protein
MFAVVSWTAGDFKVDNNTLEQKMAEGVKDDEARLRKLEEQRAGLKGQGAGTAQIDARIAEMKNDLSLARQIASNGADGAIVRASDDMPASLRTLNQAYRKAKSNPNLMLYKLKSNAYKYSWALIPLSLPLMWLLFPFSKRWRMYDHTVFVTYSLCFMTLLVVVGSLWRAVGIPKVGILLLIPPIHMYRQLRGAYSLSRLSALWRSVVLTFGAFTISMVFAVCLLLTGIFD